MDSTNNVEQTDYYERINKLFLGLLWGHLPICLFTAYMCNQSLMTAALLSLAILSLPTFFVLRHSASAEASIANAMAIVCFSALMIHLSGGMTELHFHIFAALGVMIMLAQPWAIAAALGVVVVHHIGFFFFLPRSLINYDASFGILVIHAVFALGVGVPAFFISKKFRVYIVGVKGIVNEIQGITVNMAAASTSMLTNSKTLAESTDREVAATTQTSASLQGLRDMISKNSNHAENVAKSSGDSKQKSNHGLQVMINVVNSLGEIKTNSKDVIHVVDQSNQHIEQIIKMIEAIGEKTQVIHEIVFQTKLLSFNASVEAARAGEQGRGFSVVAQEIGDLAQKSGSSAKEITDLLTKSIASVQDIISQSKNDIGRIVGDGHDKIERGLHIAEECKSILTEIDNNLNNVSEMAAQIEISSKEQSNSVTEISKAMQEVELASQQNSEVSRNTEQKASDVDAGTKQLNEAILRLAKAV